MQTKAVLRYARISPQKCRLVVDTIRGKSATLAVNTLKFMPKKGAKIVLKVLDSAIANAYNNFNADVDDLKVTRIEVDPAPLLKRFHARAKGRGVRIAKPHYALARATSAALMPSSASPYPTPSSMMRLSFWVMAIRV